jgi:hypothetical protein
MPTLNDMFPSRFLKAQDLKGGRRTVTVLKVTEEEIGDETKFVCWFKELEKALALNKTNAVTLSELSGSESSDDWADLAVDLFVVRVNFQGKMTPAIRIDAATRKPSNGRVQKPLPLADKTDEPADSGETDPSAEAAEGFDWATGKEASGGKS